MNLFRYFVYRWLPAFAGMALLSACGFQPVAATAPSATETPLAADMAGIRVNISSLPEQRLLGQHFKSELEDLLNPGGASGHRQYELHVNLGTLVAPGLIAPDGKAQRFLVTLQSSYQLVRLSDNKRISKGTLQRVGSYNNLPNAYFSTYVADQDMLKRLAHALAAEYRLRLASALAHSDTASADTVSTDETNH